MKKMNKNIFICALLILMLFLCVNAASAEDSLNQNLASGDATPIVASDADDSSLLAQDDSSDASNGVVGDSSRTIIVNSSGSGDYETISEAVNNANGIATATINLALNIGKYNIKSTYEGTSVIKSITIK